MAGHFTQDRRRSRNRSQGLPRPEGRNPGFRKVSAISRTNAASGESRSTQRATSTKCSPSLENSNSLRRHKERISEAEASRIAE